MVSPASRHSRNSAAKIGRMWGQLMAQLGYGRHVARGDWGSMITQEMALSEAGHCAGIHITLPIIAPDPATMDELTPAEQSALEAMAFYNEHDSLLQAAVHRPQTLGYALADSPVGQMAWVVEKYYAWTDCERDGGSIRSDASAATSCSTR